MKSKRGNLGFDVQFSFELKSFDLQQKRKEMGWMAEALHRSIGNWTAGAITTCIGSEKEKKSCRKSKRGPDCKTLQGSHVS